MLIQQLIKKQQVKLAVLTEQSQLQQQELLLRKQQLSQSALAFIGSTPGLLLSFSVGCLFQLRHNSLVKTLRSVVGFRWIAQLIR
ncbi:hypothetical protein [Rheinheimera tangshanensis]|mgnify:FL=1|jgi:hypothetical protein|uniref:Uncharacterized protein n=1 Tax=Rheinheimera tangshanensis TaxID=400153 RepID=A0A5C8LQZ7_9GAMM|nr:hypothetical protein [Rheinheimera tangshanensis]TXK78039.1 hypothetical protein FU839_17300 [Rheinheimera tangshanensis]GGM70618.1 hypothetical protein GCM10010920_34300 [Rheinheimera tangshanensis]